MATRLGGSSKLPNKIISNRYCPLIAFDCLARGHMPFRKMTRTRRQPGTKSSASCVAEGSCTKIRIPSKKRMCQCTRLSSTFSFALFAFWASHSLAWPSRKACTGSFSSIHAQCMFWRAMLFPPQAPLRRRELKQH